jgi:hypothetical protein
MFLRRFLKQPVRAQEELLRRILIRASDTEWGRRHTFAGIATSTELVKTYQETVALQSYEDMRPYVDRMRAGEPDVLWPGRVRYFAASSGTTSTGRIVPVSREMLASNRRFALEVIANYVKTNRRSGLFFGRHLSLPGWIEDDRPELGTRIGQISAILAESGSWLTVPWRALDNRIGFIENWEDKMAAIADHTMDQDVRLIAIAPSWGQVLFRLVAERYRSKTGVPKKISEIWPNLSTIVTGGVALSGYRDILQHYLGESRVDMVETYGASEGFISYQDDLTDPAMLIHLDNGVFFEFVPTDELGASEPSRLTIDEVTTGVPYAPHVTSNSGFYSYCLGDVIRFTSINPHKIVVVGRTVDMLDKYGEAVFGSEARLALDAACARTSASVLHYHVTHTAVSSGETPAHHWLIEFEMPPADLDQFARILDDELKRAGHHYEDRREGMAFDRPTVTSLQPGTFFDAMQEGGKRLSVQTKVPAMSEERTFAEQVLGYAETGRRD